MVEVAGITIAENPSRKEETRLIRETAALTTVHGIGPKTAARIMREHASLDGVLSMSANELARRTPYVSFRQAADVIEGRDMVLETYDRLNTAPEVKEVADPE